MKYQVKLFAFFLFIFGSAYSQVGIYPTYNYTTRDYGRDYHPTNMAIIQDQRGLIYAANGFKLLEYDGSHWKSYPINKETWILSLAVDTNGIIYAGSQNEFGFFAPDTKGELKYHSLSDSLKPEERNFTNIWRVHAYKNGIVFQSEEALYIYRNGIVYLVKPETSFHTSFLVNDRLFVRERGIGIMEYNDNNLRKITGSEIFDTTGIFLMLPFLSSENKVLIGTREKGFWIMESGNRSSRFRKFITSDDRFLEKAVITGGTVTGNGSFAIGTMQNGIVIIDSAGLIKESVDTKEGLPDNEVKDIILDQGNNLWAALNNGISRIEISSQLSSFNERSGLTGSVNTVSRFQKLLFIGTSMGLMVQEKNTYSGMPFRSVQGLSVPVRCLVNTEGSLLAGTDAGLFMISGNRVVKLDPDESYTLMYHPGLKLLLSGGPKGLKTWVYTNSFRRQESFSIRGEDIIGIASETGRQDSIKEFWLGTRYSGVIRIRLNHDFSFTSERFNTADGLPDGPIIPSSLGSKTVFETSRGLYSFINENIVRESVPDSLKNNTNFIKGFFSIVGNLPENIGESVSVLVESGDKVWICSDNNVGYLDKNDSMRYNTRPFRGIESGKINMILPESDGICWIGTTEGLIRYDENQQKDYNQNYYTLIRKATLTDRDSAIFLGTFFGIRQGWTRIIPSQSSGMKPSLAYRNNSIRLDFTASSYEYPAKILYSYRLEGRSQRWSTWTRENYQEFTNLKEGDYVFQVRAMNIFGKESYMAQYGFNIQTPWYRSAASYIAYVITGLILFWLFARLYSYRLKKENVRLEGIVAERTAEIVQKNMVLEHQKKEIEDSIRYARRIQTAVLPSENVCRGILPESFVFFRPLNIVSGDFYWISRVGSRIIYTAADCTGHGVPGAFMSMLGVAFLNEIVNKDNITSPDLILKLLRDKVIGALQQHGVSGETRDGMDLSLVSIDTAAGKLEYSGAFNPLVMLRKGRIVDTPGDKMPIGIYDNMQDFTRHEIRIEKGDVFYMYSDGYEDQFGGAEGKKFKSKRLKNLFLEIYALPAADQKEILEKTFEEWKGDLPQVDDVVVVGIVIK